MKFLCDEMLGGLARWLRAAGYDAAMATSGAPDRDLVEQAHTQGRTLLTRDRAILDIKGAKAVTHLLKAELLDGWAQELRDGLGVDWQAAPFTRCLVCNVDLIEADALTRARMPEDSRNGEGPFRECPKCHRGYWPGSHVKRMRKRLQAFAGLAHGDGP